LKFLGEYECILDRHAAALAHHRRHSVRSVTDENDPLGAPGGFRQPIDR